MSRLKVALLAFCCVGGLAAVSVSDRGAFVVGFVALMFGGIAAAVAMVASPRGEVAVPELVSPDPFTDELGVQRYPGDVFDMENHPRPGLFPARAGCSGARLQSSDADRSSAESAVSHMDLWLLPP